MGMFAETAIIDYRFSFADQGKQTAIFRLKKTNGSLETWRHGDMDMETSDRKRKQKPRRFPLINNPRFNIFISFFLILCTTGSPVVTGL
jgi:hypothetical protein